MQKEIILFTHEDEYSKKLKSLLNQLNVPYYELRANHGLNLGANKETQEDMERWLKRCNDKSYGQTAFMEIQTHAWQKGKNKRMEFPMMVIGQEELIIGFDENKIREKLDKQDNNMDIFFQDSIQNKESCDFATYNDKGIELYNNGRYDEAVKCFDKALKIEPDNEQLMINKETVLNNWGINLYNNKDYDGALECYDKVLELNPNNKSAMKNKAELFNNIGVKLHNNGNYEKAIEYYDKALSITPNNVTILQNKENAMSNMK